MRVRDSNEATLAELVHAFSTEPGSYTKGHYWRALVAAFWRGELRASNWTREQLREIGHCCLRSGKELPPVAPDEKGMTAGEWLDKEHATAQHIILNGKAATRESPLCEGDKVCIVTPLNALPFQRISELAKRAYSLEFKQRYLDALLFNPADAECCLSRKCMDVDQRLDKHEGKKAPVPRATPIHGYNLRSPLKAWYRDEWVRGARWREWLAKNDRAPRNAPQVKPRKPIQLRWRRCRSSES